MLWAHDAQVLLDGEIRIAQLQRLGIGDQALVGSPEQEREQADVEMGVRQVDADSPAFAAAVDRGGGVGSTTPVPSGPIKSRIT